GDVIDEFKFNTSSFNNVTPRFQANYGSSFYGFDTNFNSGTINLNKGGRGTSLIQANYQFSPNTNYQVKMKVGGPNVALWINNQLIGTASDSAQLIGSGT